MSSQGLENARTIMTQAGIGDAAIQAFCHHYRELESSDTGLIREDQIEPLGQIPHINQIAIDQDQAIDALAKTAVIKLNGGLGTSMGLQGPKSLLVVRDGLTFCDLIVRQILALRERYRVELPLIFMNSFATHDATAEFMSRYPQIAHDGGLPDYFGQSREPKLCADTLEPVSWPDNPDLEWCPPGHGDIYPSLVDSGMLDALLDAGFAYASISNCDNLGAVADPALAGWFAGSGAPFALEVCQRTPNDRKGGHLAVRRSDEQIILRESAQTAEEDQPYFADETRHRYFNTNNLWIDLEALKYTLASNNGVLPLPTMRNMKTVDPRDPSSPSVIQIETAMGAAIELFDNPAVIEVPRDRFMPVKKTNELALMRSDCFALDEHTAQLRAVTQALPQIDLDARFFGKVDDFESRMPHPLVLRGAQRLRVHGDVRFGSGIVVNGKVDLDASSPTAIPDGTILDAQSRL